MTIRISAIIATRNRANYLRKALDSLVHQTLAPEFYEIIVVDNGSEDNTRQVVEEFAFQSNLRYIFEPVTGVSKARNTGWKSAQGEFIAFIDDDAVADPQWLAKYIETFNKYQPGVGSIGGKVELIWEVSKPDWLSPSLLGILSVYHYSDEPVILDTGQWLSICNLSYPREVLASANGLREDLGRKGNTLLAGADTYLREQIDEWGLKTIYHPDIIVHHHMSPYRLTKKWFIKAADWQGKSSAIRLNPVEKPLSFGKKMRLAISRLFWSVPRFGLALVAIDPAERFRRWFQIVETKGFIEGLFVNQR